MRHLLILAGILVLGTGNLFAEGPGHHDGNPPPPPQAGIEKFLERYPAEEQARLKKLMKEDHHAFVRELRAKFQAERRKEFNDLLALRTRYLNAADAKEKEAAKAELTKKMTEQNQRHLQAAERRIKETEQKLKWMQESLERFRKKVEDSKKNQSAEIQKKVSAFLDPDKVPVMEMPPRKRPGFRYGPGRGGQPPHDGPGMQPPPPPPHP